MLKKPLDVLKKYWDYHSFRPQQEAIINSVLNKQDTFVLLPTGGGKSICYQIPTLLRDGICLVVSPLIALMKDQVQQLKQKGIPAIALDSSLRYTDLNRELDNCLYGNYKFIYISPERLQSELLINRLPNLNINGIAVDEAHCISQWGNDFRPAYSNIQHIKKLLPNTPIIAVTGSAKPKVVDDIIRNLQLQNTAIFKSSFRRKNLAYMVFETRNKQQRILQIVTKNKQSSIIYVSNRNKTQQIAQFLQDNAISATYYHGGLTTKQKDTHFKLWMLNDAQVMVATNAFGMGIDKPDVKTVIHINLPENIENYYQEAGRAGRNGDKAFGLILYEKDDIKRLQKRALSALPTVDDVKFIYRKLCSAAGIAYQEGEMETFDFNIHHFSLFYKVNIHKIIHTLTFLDRQGVLRFQKEFKSKTTLQFLVDNYNLIRFIENNKQYNALINFIIRKHTGGFDAPITINLNQISAKLELKKEIIKEYLLVLEKKEIIKLHLFDSDINITLLLPREDHRTINPIAKYLTLQNTLKVNQVEAIIDYVTNTSTCKEKLLLHYFGEKTEINCGVCSYCIADKINIIKNIPDCKAKILALLTTQKRATVNQLVTRLKINEATIVKALHELLDNQEVIQQFDQYVFIQK